jgi:hypothetical protein
MKVFSMSASIVVLLLISSCAVPEENARPSGRGITCPYKASPERRNEIMSGFVKLVPGMPKAEAVKIMGEPDEVNKIYKSMSDMEKGYASGETYTYLLGRKRKLGFFIERQEKLVKLHFNLNGILTNIDKQGVR